MCIGRTSGLPGASYDVRLKLNVLVLEWWGLCPLYLGLQVQNTSTYQSHFEGCCSIRIHVFREHNFGGQYLVLWHWYAGSNKRVNLIICLTTYLPSPTMKSICMQH